jgi:uncharacterized glyoxalase superfamily protein PhnB
MSQPDSIEAPRLYHTMRCEDAEAMIAWLKNVLGFVEHVIYRRDGKVVHAELAFGSSILMLGANRDDDYAKRVGDLGGRRTDALYLAVDDPDALCEKVRASGTRIDVELHTTDYGSRDFAARDPEGGLWSFGTYWPKVGEAPLPG